MANAMTWAYPLSPASENAGKKQTRTFTLKAEGALRTPGYDLLSDAPMAVAPMMLRIGKSDWIAALRITRYLREFMRSEATLAHAPRLSWYDGHAAIDKKQAKRMLQHLVNTAINNKAQEKSCGNIGVGKRWQMRGAVC